MSTNPRADFYRVAHDCVTFIAQNVSPIRYRLRKYDADSQADIIKLTTERVCATGLDFIRSNAPSFWPIFQRSLEDPETLDTVLKALDSSRKKFDRQNGWTGGHTDKVDRDTEERLARFTEFGLANDTEPTAALERIEAEATEERAPEIQAAENEAYQREADEYESQQTKPKHREAVRLLRRGFSYEAIRKQTTNSEGRRGISERILKPHKDALTRIAEKHLRTADDGQLYDELPEARSPDTLHAEEAPESETPAPVTMIEQEVRGPNGSKSGEITGDFTSDGCAIAPAEDVALSGGFRAAAAYVGSEDAQFDARDKLDPYDSANYRGSKHTDNGRPSGGRRKFSDASLVTGAGRAELIPEVTIYAPVLDFGYGRRRTGDKELGLSAIAPRKGRRTAVDSAGARKHNKMMLKAEADAIAARLAEKAARAAAQRTTLEAQRARRERIEAQRWATAVKALSRLGWLTEADLQRLYDEYRRRGQSLEELLATLGAAAAMEF